MFWVAVDAHSKVEVMKVTTATKTIEAIRKRFHSASNGLAERFVQSLKTGLKASLDSGLPLQQRLANFLLTYRSSPHANTEISPCSLFLHRQVRTRLDLLRPNLETHTKKATINSRFCKSLYLSIVSEFSDIRLPQLFMVD